MIKKLVENKSSKERASVKLDCSIRQINRMIKGYNLHGKEFFKHGNRSRKPSSAISNEIKDKILKLYREKYFDFNFFHFHEKLIKFESITCSYPTVKTILYTNGILSKKSHKKTKKKLITALKIVAKEDLGNIQLTTDHAINPKLAHPRLPRAKYFGELIQMDASFEAWYGKEKSYLHLAIDDSTGMIVGAYFDTQETLKGYYQVTAQILKKYGIPAKFLTDRRTVFEYKKSGSKEIENDYSTQFGYACSKLGIAIETSSIPQAKGRVERVFGTLQSRLKAELRLSNVTDIISANDFLVEYIEQFNKEFSIDFNFIKNVFEKQLNLEEINLHLSILHERIIDKGHSIKFENNYYFPLDKQGKDLYLKPKTRVNILKSLDGKKYLSLENEVYDVR
ncbi:MAG: ISNCY family transposase, partial [Fusobacteriaceae bacterium]